MPFKTIKEVRRYLESIPRFQTSGKSAADFDLDRFRKFCEAAGNPQNDFPSIHVGGTNGKGSTCQILASIYQQAGYKTGIYTSPHMLDFSERFKINSEAISEEGLLEFFNHHESLLKSFRLTYFEISTAIAFWYFSERQVDLAIIEVGLGGRLDATNVITPEVSVITNVSLDHTDILGDTISDIAAEKGGIIKPGKPVVLGNVNDEAKKVLQEIARVKGAPLHDIEELHPKCNKGSYILHPDNKELLLESDLYAPVQVYNLAAAWLVCRLLNEKYPLKPEQFRNGIANVRALYPSLGRFERLHDRFEWYFDGAHNPEAVRAMKQTAGSLAPLNQCSIVLSMMSDKVNEQLINEFSVFNKIFYYELNTQRAATINQIKQHLPSVRPFPVTKKQQKLVFEEFETELVIFTGSFYFYSTVRDWIATFANNR